MNEQQLLRALGDVQPTYLAESEQPPQNTPKESHWKRWAALAACVCLIAGAALYHRFGGAKGSTPASTAGGGGRNIEEQSDTEASSFMSYAGPMFPLTLESAAGELTAERAITMDFAPCATRTVTEDDGNGGEFSYEIQSQSIAVTDDYVLTNSSNHDVTVTALYPFVSSIYELEEQRPAITVDGVTVEAPIYSGDFCGGFRPVEQTRPQERWNIDRFNSWEDYVPVVTDSYLQNALSATAELDQTVYVYTLTATGETDEDAATVAMSFQLDSEKSTVLTYSFNGYGYDPETGEEQHSFFTRNLRVAPRLAIVGEDIERYTLQGYQNGGCYPGTELDEISADVVREEMTLSDFLRMITTEALYAFPVYGDYDHVEPTAQTEELFYRAAVEFLLNYGVLSDHPAERYDSGRLDDLLLDTRSVDRVCYAAFELTVPAGASVTVSAQYRKPASYDFYGASNGRERLAGYDLVTQLGSDLTFTRQTASVETRGLVEIVQQNFGFDAENGVTTVILDPSVEHYYMNVVFLKN